MSDDNDLRNLFGLLGDSDAQEYKRKVAAIEHTKRTLFEQIRDHFTSAQAEKRAAKSAGKQANMSGYAYTRPQQDGGKSAGCGRYKGDYESRPDRAGTVPEWDGYNGE